MLELLEDFLIEATWSAYYANRVDEDTFFDITIYFSHHYLGKYDEKYLINYREAEVEREQMYEEIYGSHNYMIHDERWML
jgi:hypothetical protein